MGDAHGDGTERLARHRGERSCRAIVLTGAGGNLFAGGDISEMKHREILEAQDRMDLPTSTLAVSAAKAVLWRWRATRPVQACPSSAASDHAVRRATQIFLRLHQGGIDADVGGIWSLPRKVATQGHGIVRLRAKVSMRPKPCGFNHHDSIMHEHPGQRHLPLRSSSGGNAACPGHRTDRI